MAAVMEAAVMPLRSVAAAAVMFRPVAAAVAAAVGSACRTKVAAASALRRWGLLIDIGKCADCDDCVTACNEENGIVGNGRPETDPQ